MAGTEYIRKILQFLADGRNGQSRLEKVFSSYHNPSGKLIHRIGFGPLHKAIDYFAGKAGISPAVISENLSLRPWAVRALAAVARSVAEYGLTEPQDFIGPLAVVWNTTKRCNLACRHCSLDSGGEAIDVLSRREKIAVVDQLAEKGVSIVVMAGGEPFMDPDLWSVLERTRQHGIYTMIATNGTLLDPESCRRLLASGVKYLEVSLDSPDPKVHDNFRGSRGRGRNRFRESGSR